MGHAQRKIERTIRAEKDSLTQYRDDVKTQKSKVLQRKSGLYCYCSDSGWRPQQNL